MPKASPEITPTPASASSRATLCVQAVAQGLALRVPTMPMLRSLGGSSPFRYSTAGGLSSCHNTGG